METHGSKNRITMCGGEGSKNRRHALKINKMKRCIHGLSNRHA